MQKNVYNILKYLLLIVLILNLISLIVPWGNLNGGLFGKVDFYNWGTYTNSVSGQEGGYSFYPFFINPNYFNDYFGISDNEIGFIPTIFATLLIILISSVIILTINYILKNSYSKKDISFIAILSSLSVISFYIFIQFGILSLLSSNIIPFEFSIGFYLVILSICILIVTYFIFDYYSIEKTNQKNNEKTPLDILKMRYVKGEISSEEFDSMKNNLE